MPLAGRGNRRKIPIALIMTLRWALECNGLVSSTIQPYAHKTACYLHFPRVRSNLRAPITFRVDWQSCQWSWPDLCT